MEPRLAPDLIFAADAVARGDDDRQLARACRDGHLHRVWRGVYAATDHWLSLDPRRRQLHRAIAAARTRRRADLVLSHESAALLWGLPTWGWPHGHVEFIAPNTTTTRSTAATRIHGARLRDDEVMVHDGVALTSLERTVVDLLLSRDRLQSVVLVDHLLRTATLAREELASSLRSRPSARNGRRASWATAFGDARADSPGESASRVLALDAGFVAPDLQRAFSDHRGLIGVVDFFFQDPDDSGSGRIGEFDGEVKYRGDAFRHGRSAEQVVVDEKTREDRLRALPTTTGFARWTRGDLARPALFASVLDRAGVARAR